MYNLDSLSLKFLIEENADFLNGAVVQKIQMPSRREILLSMRNLGENRKFYINLNPKFPHLNFITQKPLYAFKIPQEPPMFCMLLRKHLEGAKLSRVQVVEYERIVELYFDIYDEIGSKTPMCLALELMGKHSNAVLYNAKNKIIAGCLHNISPEKSSVREIWGGVNYIYPPKQDKTDILRTSISEFYTLSDVEISSRYYYLSKGLTDFTLESAAAQGFIDDRAKLFSYLQNIIAGKTTVVRDFWIKNLENEGISLDMSDIRCLNPLIEVYFSNFVMKDLLEKKKKTLETLVAKEISRLNSVLQNADKKTSYLAYKQLGELILANIYKIPEGAEKITLEGAEIRLDPFKTPAQNAQTFFGLYSKGKTAHDVATVRAKEAQNTLEYLNSVLFTIKNADKPEFLDEIADEMTDFTGNSGAAVLKPRGVQKSAKSKEKLNVQTIVHEGFELLLGKNNKQNDYLIKKLSSPEDIWFHALGCPSSHVFVRTENGRKQVPDSVLLYAAKLVKQNSPMRESAKASIIYTKRKYLKRPPDTHLAYVTYREEKEIVV